MSVDRLFIDEDDKNLYEVLKREFGSAERMSNKDAFLLAMAVGFKNGVKEKIKRKFGYVRNEYLKSEDRTLLDAIAVNTIEKIDVLMDDDEVFKIAEEYAHAGIRLLADEIKASSFGSFTKKFEKELFELLKEINKDSEYEEEISSS